MIVVLAAMVLAVKMIPAAGYLVMIGLAAHALRGTRQSMEALILLAFCLVVNKAVMPVSQVYTFRWLILFAAFGRLLWDTFINGARFPRLPASLHLFWFTALVFALFVSFMPTVSVLKIISFTVGVVTILAGFHRTIHLKEYWLSFLVTLGTFIVVASIPLYFMDAGYVKNGTGFQGILVHPQSSGFVMAMFAALLTGMVIFERIRARWLLALTALSWFWVYASLSRTALLALLLGMVFCGAAAVMSKRGVWRVQINQALSSKPVMVIGVVLIGFSIASWSELALKASDFLLKDDAVEDGGITDALMSSRESLIDRSMANFYASPITGIGFGVPSDASSARVETGFLGLPTGASVEKGFMPAAVLEETGLVGAVLVLMLLWALLVPIMRSGSLTLFWMALVAVLVNMGEAIFFSVGGTGFLMWIAIGFAYTHAVGKDAS